MVQCWCVYCSYGYIQTCCTTDSICELIFVKKWFPSFVCVQCLFVSSELVYTIWSSSSRSPRHQRPVSTQKDVYWDGSMAPTISESVVTRELSCANYVFQKYDLTTIWGRPPHSPSLRPHVLILQHEVQVRSANKEIIIWVSSSPREPRLKYLPKMRGWPPRLRLVSSSIS